MKAGNECMNASAKPIDMSMFHATKLQHAYSQCLMDSLLYLYLLFHFRNENKQLYKLDEICWHCLLHNLKGLKYTKNNISGSTLDSNLCVLTSAKGSTPLFFFNSLENITLWVCLGQLLLSEKMVVKLQQRNQLWLSVIRWLYYTYLLVSVDLSVI